MTKEFKKWLEEGSPERRRMGWHEEVLYELEQHATRIENRLHRFFVKALVAIAVIGMTSALALAGFALVLSQIKETRKDFVRDSCGAQNTRNHNVTQFIDGVAQDQLKHAKTSAERKAIAKALGQWHVLIGLQAPLQNCEHLAKVAVGEADPSPPVPSARKEKP